MLAAFGLALHDDAGRQVRHADGARGFVHVLAPRAAGSEHVFANIFVADLDFGAFADLGRNINRREAGLAFAFRIEGADSHQPMHAGFALQIAVGHRSANHQRGTGNAGLFIILPIEQFHRIAVLLSPLDVHPQQHLGPIVGVDAAVAGVDRENRARGVVRAVEQRLEFQIVEDRLDAVEFARHFAAKLSSSAAISSMASRSPSEVSISRMGLSSAVSDFSSAIVAWAFSWLSQKPGLPISASMASRRACFVAASKRVSKLGDSLADLFCPKGQFAVHAASKPRWNSAINDRA